MTRDILAWRKRDASTPPPLLQYRSSYWFVLSTICIAVFTDIFLYGIIVPVIPFSLITRLAIPQTSIQHWTSILLAASPICGHFADHTPSRRLPLLIGLLALAGSTLLLCLGNSIALLVVGRILQGISAAIVWTVGLALLADTVGHDTIGQSMGFVTMSMSVAVLVAPLLGGVVYARAGYFAVFYMAFGLIALDVILRTMLVEKKIAKQWDPVPSSPAAGNMPSPSLSDEKPLSELPTPTAASPFVSDAELPPRKLSISPEEKPLRSKATHPLLLLLTSRRLLSALFCTLCQATLLTAWDAVLPLRVSTLFGWTSLGAGLIFLPLILPSFVAPMIGYWSDKRGPRVPTALGFVLAIPFLVLLRLVDHGGVEQVVLLCVLLAFLGLALSMAMTPLLAEITYVVRHKEKTHPGAFGGRGAYATAYGLFNTAFAGGMLIGPIWGGFVTLKAGWGTMCWSLAVLSLAGAVVAGLFTGGWVGGKGEEGEKGDEVVV